MPVTENDELFIIPPPSPTTRDASQWIYAEHAHLPGLTGWVPRSVISRTIPTPPQPAAQPAAPILSAPPIGATPDAAPSDAPRKQTFGSISSPTAMLARARSWAPRRKAAAAAAAAVPQISPSSSSSSIGLGPGTPEPMPSARSLAQEDPVLSGWLTKQGEVVKSWKRRWFVLTKTFCVYYFKTPDEEAALGKISMPGCEVSTATKIMTNGFKVAGQGARTYFLSADSPVVMDRWMYHLQLATKSRLPDPKGMWTKGKGENGTFHDCFMYFTLYLFHFMTLFCSFYDYFLLFVSHFFHFLCIFSPFSATFPATFPAL